MIPPRSGKQPADGPAGIVHSSCAERGYDNGHQVRVLPPSDPYAGRVGTVQRTFRDDGGETVHVVHFVGERGDFPPGPIQKAYYLADELESAEVGVGDGAKSAPTEYES